MQKLFLEALKTELYNGTRRFTVTVCLKEEDGKLLAWVVSLVTYTERFVRSRVVLTMVLGLPGYSRT